MSVFIEQGLLFFLDLYKNHYQKQKDWVPTNQEIQEMRKRNQTEDAAWYEAQAAANLGLPVPPPPQ